MSASRHRNGTTARGWKRRPAGLVPAGLLVLLAGCATSAPEAPRSHVPEREAAYLLDPLTGYPLTADPALERQIHDGYQTLWSGGDLAAVAASTHALMESHPGFHPAPVLMAEIAYVRGRAEGFSAAAAEARELLSPVVDELPDYLAAQMLWGRLAERLDDLPQAWRAYDHLAGASSVARQRAAELAPRVIDILTRRIGELVDRGHLEEAERQLAELTSWAGDVPAVLESRRSLAVAEGDVEAEREVLRRLVIERPDDDEIAERLADLDLVAGDVRAGLRRLEDLAVRRPDDEELADKVSRAKFLRRLQLLPSFVQEMAAEGVLTRAELATLLYWLVPAVRYADVTEPPIATDILDHPRREEVLRVMNLGLIPVDETLHRFSPEEPATRSDALGALLGLLRISHADYACLSESEARALAAASRRWICRKAADCRLIPEEADCLPQASLSGPDALDLFRRCLDLLGS